MPPLKERTKKRKQIEDKSAKTQPKTKNINEVTEESSEDELDLLTNVNNEDGDSTDSEGEVEDSDGEMDKPIFASDDEDDLSLESSSPGEDSEDDESDEDSDDESESGFGQASSDEDEHEKKNDSKNTNKASLNKSNAKTVDKNNKKKLKSQNSSKSQQNSEKSAKNTEDKSLNAEKLSNVKDTKSKFKRVNAKNKVETNNSNNKGPKSTDKNKVKTNNSNKKGPKSTDKNKVETNNSNNKGPKTTDKNKVETNNSNNKGPKSTDKKVPRSNPEMKSNKKERGNTNEASKPILNNDEKKDEYLSGDSSDEEDRRNTVGDIPLHWYNDYPHIGYDWDGKQILKPPQRDQIEEFLKRCEDPDFWRTVRDPMTGQDVVLSKADLEILARLKQGKTPDPTFEDYPEWVEWFSSEVLQTPVRAFPEHKRSFLPSQLEQRQVNRLVRALRAGWIKTRAQDRIDREKKKEVRFYMLWSADDRAEEMRRIRNHIPAPKRNLPGHAESYNPPPEYLLDEREMKQWKKLENSPWKRKYTFLPQKFASLREVPAYSRYIRERFLRCLDLYLAPRAIKMRLTIDPHQLVPKLPSPQDLQPFPTVESLVFRGHTDMVRCIDVDPTGQYLYSGSDDGTVKIWEVSTGRCLKTTQLDRGAVKSVQCTPVSSLSLLAVACGQHMLLLSPGTGVGDHKVAERTEQLLAEAPDNSEYIPEDRIRTAVQWETVTPEQWKLGIRISVSHFKEVKQAVWHGRGDYVCAVLPEGLNRSVIVHQVSRRRSQLPFSRAKGMVQCALFHPIRPFLFVATQRIVRVYDLVKQELVKKLLTSAQWISNIAIHPAGDNLLVASYDRKMMWFDLDLSSKPYQTLRLHGAAVRGVAFHKRYPLFASGSDDRKLIISHGMVYNDLLQNPLIVPLKQLQTHEAHEDFGILSVTFHPLQPWVFSAGADSTIRLYT